MTQLTLNTVIEEMAHEVVAQFADDCPSKAWFALRRRGYTSALLNIVFDDVMAETQRILAMPPRNVIFMNPRVSQ